MRISIENMGPISKCDIEQKPLTVFVGPNGYGKTWTAYLITCLFGMYMYNRYVEDYPDNLDDDYPIVDDTLEKLLDEGSAKVDLELFFEENSSKYMHNISKLLPKYFGDYLAADSISFEDLKISLDFDYHKCLEVAKGHYFKKAMSVNKKGEALLVMESPKDDLNLYIYSRSDSELKEKLPPFIIRKEIASSLFMLIHRSFFDVDHYLPPERTGMIPIISYMASESCSDSVETEIANVETSEFDEKNLYMAFPVAKMLQMVSDTFSSPKRRNRVENTEDNAKIQKYVSLGEILESEILGGNIKVDDSKDKNAGIKFKLPDIDKYFNLPPLSSSVKDLSLLILYLKYFAKDGQVIVIDEPEMNLHPEVQVKVMELLCMMVNSGLNVIITTHSPYLVDHISNLIKAYNLKEEGKIGLENKFLLKNDLSFLNPDDVSVYLFDKGTVSNILTEEGIVDWQTFGDVSDYVSNLYYDLKEE